MTINYIDTTDKNAAFVRKQKGVYKNERGTWTLRGSETGVSIAIGDKINTFRNEPFELRAAHPPHKPDSGGKLEVHCLNDGSRPGDDFHTITLYPSVFNLKFVRE